MDILLLFIAAISAVAGSFLKPYTESGVSKWTWVFVVLPIITLVIAGLIQFQKDMKAGAHEAMYSALVSSLLLQETGELKKISKELDSSVISLVQHMEGRDAEQLSDAFLSTGWLENYKEFRQLNGARLINVAGGLSGLDKATLESDYVKNNFCPWVTELASVEAWFNAHLVLDGAAWHSQSIIRSSGCNNPNCPSEKLLTLASHCSGDITVPKTIAELWNDYL